MTRPTIIPFETIGSPDIGYISIAQGAAMPFVVKRVFWTYATPADVIRGNHAHKELQQVIVATSGAIDVASENLAGEEFVFRLDNPYTGLFIPPLCWNKFRLSNSAVMLCMASEEFSEDDYIRDYNAYKVFKNKHILG